MDEQHEKGEYKVPGRVDLETLHREEQEIREFNEITKRKQGPKLLNAMSLVSAGLDFAVILALPLIIGIYVGRYVDGKMGTKYWVIVGILLAMFASAVGIYRHTKRLAKLMKMKK
jgi:F0F1-type ATP synthase assembly protein I